MKKYLIILIALFFIPFNVDALEIKIDENGNNGNVMFSEKKDFELTLYKSDSSETYVSNIDKISFDFTNYNGDVLQSYSVEKNNIFSFYLDTNNYDIGTYYLDNIVCYASSESYNYSDKIEINILTPDFEGPVLNSLSSYESTYVTGSFYLDVDIDDYNGISSFNAVFENQSGSTFSMDANYISNSLIGFSRTIYHDFGYDVWKVKSVTICDSSIQRNCSVYSSSNFNFESSYFISVNNNLELTTFKMNNIEINNRFVKQNEKLVIDLDLEKKYDYVFVEVSGRISLTSKYNYDKRLVKMVYKNGFYTGDFDMSLLSEEYGVISKVLVFNNGGAFYEYELTEEDTKKTYFTKNVSSNDNDKTYPLFLDAFFEKNDYLAGDIAKVYIEFYDDMSDLAKVYYKFSSIDQTHLLVASTTVIYKENGLYYFYVELPDDVGTSYSINYITCYDASGKGISFSNPYDLNLKTHINPLDIEVVSVPNEKFAINTEIDLKDFKVLGVFDNDLRLDITNLVTIDELSQVGIQKTYIRYKEIFKEIELEGFIPNILLSKNEITIETNEKHDLSNYVTIDDYRYNNLEKKYTILNNDDFASIDKFGVFSSNKYGKYDVNICISNISCKLLKVNVNPIKISDVEFVDSNKYIWSDSLSVDLKLNITPSNGDKEFLKFESLNEDIVTVNKDGVMNFIGYGNAKIRIYTDYGFNKIVEINSIKKISSIDLDSYNLVLIEGIPYKLNLKFSPDDYTENYSVFDLYSYQYKFNSEIDEIIFNSSGEYSFRICSETNLCSDYINVKVLKNVSNINIYDKQFDLNITDKIYFYYSFDVDDYFVSMADYLKLSIDNDDVASFKHFPDDKRIEIIGIKHGTASLTIETINGVKEVIKINVNSKIKDIAFYWFDSFIRVGEQINVKLSLYPIVHDDKITWSSCNSKIASVDQKGNIKGVSVGKTCIIVTTSSGLKIKTDVNIESPLTPSIINFSQYNTNQVKLSWDKAETYNYFVYRATSKNGSYKKIATTSKLYFVDKTVSNGKTYYYKIKSDWDEWSEIYSFSTPPSKPTVTVSNYGFDTLKISYKKLTGATRYDIYRSTSKNGKYTKVGSTTGTTYYDKNLIYGKTYYYKVRACNKNNICGSFSSVKSKKVTAGKPSITLSASGATGIKIKYKKVSYAKKYQIYRSTSKSKNFKLVKETTSLSFTDKVVPGVTYYYKVRACGDYSCGSYSSVKSKKLTLGKTTISKISLNDNKQVTLAYKKIDGAVGYEIYRSTKKSSGYKKIGTTTSTTYIDKPALGKTYYYKIKVYTKNGTKTIYSSYSGVKSIKVK